MKLHIRNIGEEILPELRIPAKYDFDTFYCYVKPTECEMNAITEAATKYNGNIIHILIDEWFDIWSTQVHEGVSNPEWITEKILHKIEVFKESIAFDAESSWKHATIGECIDTIIETAEVMNAAKYLFSKLNESYISSIGGESNDAQR